MAIAPEIIFAISLLMILKGADWVINGATHIARVLLIPEFVIGATVVAFGTSLPELGTSIAAMTGGLPYIVSGNVIGSNLANLALVLGLTAFIYPIYIRKSLIGKDLPFVIGSSIATLIVFYDLAVSLGEGILLILIYIAFAIDTAHEHAKGRVKKTREWFQSRKVVELILGFLALFYGAQYLISSSRSLMATFGITETILGFLVIGISTSLPEVVTSLKAARRGRGGIALGNVIGSNTFNSLGVLGAASLVGTVPIEQNFMLKTIPLMLILTLYLGFIVLDRKITRFEGAMFLLVYGLIVLSIL